MDKKNSPQKNLFDSSKISNAGNANKESSSGSSKLSGEIKKVVFVSDDETYSVIKIKDDSGNIHNVVGEFSGAFEGQRISLKGKWETHSEYGKQFRAENFKFTLPVTEDGIEKYLSSGLIHGIGPKRAKQIVSHFGNKTLDILENHSARLLEVSGLGRKTLNTIRKAWKKNAEKRETFLYFQSLGISLRYCQKIFKNYGDKSLYIVKKNPYKLADEVNGIGFIKADNIAKKLNIKHNDDERLKAGVVYSLNQLTQSGHVCYPLQEFSNYAKEILNVGDEEVDRGVYLACKYKLAYTEKVTIEGKILEMIYDSVLYNTEKELAGILPKLVSIGYHKAQKLGKIRNSDFNIELNRQQMEALDKVCKSPISIITGGPGVGKTTVISSIVEKAKQAGLKINLAAPTGRAAKRMYETTGLKSSTIHRLLKWDVQKKTFTYNEENKLNADIIIIDEASMLDIKLSLVFFKAVSPGTTVVLVGDVDQLPSVGPGTVLKDLINSEIFPVTKLVQIFRQEEKSKIVSNAHAVNSGRMIQATNSQNSENSSDFYWIEQGDNERISELIVKIVTQRIPKRFGYHPKHDIQVLTPMTKGECGTINLNNLIQNQINYGPRPQFEYGKKTFKSGDKIMQLVNNYDKGVFNGDLGIIYNIDTKNMTFSVRLEDEEEKVVDYDFSEADQITLAYAITIHKSQGSEFKAVVMPCITSHYIMLQRNLIYTAITRAKNLLVMLGTKKALSIAISNYKQNPRYSGFMNRLMKNMKNMKEIEF